MTILATRRVSEPGRTVQAPFGADQVLGMLPHRPPFALLDRVVELDPPDRAVGLKNVTMAEPWFAGHFPGQAILPGVLVAECLAQLAGVLIAAAAELAPTGQAQDGPPPPDSLGVLAEIRQFRFRRRIVPGDQLRLEVALRKRVGRAREFDCAALVDGRRAAHGSLVIVA
jgi:3-hydroxyacyl-[acyl-carrier-protein] dehydratase